MIRLGVEIDAPAAAVWEELVDLDRWPHWGPSVRAARLDDGTRRLSAGASGAVRTAPGPWVPFRVESWEVTPGRYSWSWRVAGVRATDHTVTPRGDARCHLEMGVPWWAPGYLAVVAVALRRVRERAEV